MVSEPSDFLHPYSIPGFLSFEAFPNPFYISPLTMYTVKCVFVNGCSTLLIHVKYVKRADVLICVIFASFQSGIVGFIGCNFSHIFEIIRQFRNRHGSCKIVFSIQGKSWVVEYQYPFQHYFAHRQPALTCIPILQ